jgi:hypothetical protein
MQKKSEKVTIRIPELKWVSRFATIHGLEGSSLLLHRLPPDKAAQIFNKPPKNGPLPEKEDRVFQTPEQEYDQARFLDSKGKECIPAFYFKRAMHRASSFLPGVDYDEVGCAVRIPEVLLQLKFQKRVDRFDVGRLRGQTPNPIYRAEYFNWSARLPFSFVPSILTLESVINLLNHAGLVGVGSWRPSKKGGEHGRFEVR